MRVAVFSTKRYDREFLERANARHGHDLTFFEPRLSLETAPLAKGFDAVCAFVNDVLSAEVLGRIHEAGVKLVALRAAGYNNVDLGAAKRLGIAVVRVPAYSPHAVAEHTVGLMLSLNRRIHHAYNRVREGNFALDGLLGFDFVGRTAGVVGTGKIGRVVAQILAGFGCRVLAYDPYPSSECVAQYVELDELLSRSDIVSLHMPLSPATHHLINESTLAKMKAGVMLVNTSRGGLLDTPAVIEGLKSGRIGYLGLDVYEEEADLFFENLSGQVLQDDVFARLLTFPNVLITGHQAFFTSDALAQIAETTLASISAFARGEELSNAVR
jgi:D-lactate dehydrogenase